MEVFFHMYLPSTYIMNQQLTKTYLPSIFSMTDNGICTNILEMEVFFKFILRPILEDIHLLKEISTFKDINTDEPITDNDEITTNPKVDDTISSTQ